MSEIFIPLGVVATLVVAGIGYGHTKSRVETAHERIDALDKRVTATLMTLEFKLDKVIRLAERIDERTSRGANA